VRSVFFKTIEKLAEKNDDIFLLTGDLGFKLFDGFRSQFSNRFYDIGIAESNMISVAAGLSLCNKKVYCYSIIPFLTMRAFEQIRIDVAYQNLNVKIVGAGSGFTYGMEGMTHFGLEDLCLMRTLQNMSVVVPADSVEAECVAQISCDYPGPLYIRMGKTGGPLIHDSKPDFIIGKGMIINEGNNVAIFAIGDMVHVGRDVVNQLKKKDINPTLINMHTLKPLDVETVTGIAQSHNAVFSLEEHSIQGGLGSAIAEVLAEARYNGIFKRIGIPERLENCIGDADYLREKYGLTSEKIFATILNKMEEL
jgi:transketolase